MAQLNSVTLVSLVRISSKISRLFEEIFNVYDLGHRAGRGENAGPLASTKTMWPGGKVTVASPGPHDFFFLFFFLLLLALYVAKVKVYKSGEFVYSSCGLV